MPTDAEIKADKRSEIAGKSSGGLGALVIPEVPFQPMPPGVVKRMPELEQWNRDNHARLAQWREQTNVAFSRFEATAPAE